MAGSTPVPITLGSSAHAHAEHAQFRATDLRFPPLLQLERHRHEDCLLAVVMSGAFDVHFRTRSTPVRPGTISCEPAGELHANDFTGSTTRVLILEFDPRLQPEEVQGTGIFERLGAWDAAGVQWIAANLAAECRRSDALAPLAAEALFHELLVQAARAGGARRRGPPPRWLLRARDFMNDEAEQPVRLKDIARACGVSAWELTRGFRAHFGATPGHYLRGLRIDRAAREMVDTDDSIAAIAARAGFYDQSHFSRVFRERTGMPPAAYRRELRRG